MGWNDEPTVGADTQVCPYVISLHFLTTGFRLTRIVPSGNCVPLHDGVFLDSLRHRAQSLDY